MSGVLDNGKAAGRRDRTYVGGQCIVCEEPLEYTLDKEKILQLTCAHVAHEKCFYMYIKEFDSLRCPGCDAPLGLDSSRSGNALNIGKLSNLVRSYNATDDESHITTQRSAQSTLVPFSAGEEATPIHRLSTDVRRENGSESFDLKPRIHTKKGSSGTLRSRGSVDAMQPPAHFKRQSYEQIRQLSVVGSPSVTVRNLIPPPTLSVRSEYAALTRSAQSQTVTCLITVEVVEGEWQSNVEDIQNLQSTEHKDRMRSTRSDSRSPSLERGATTEELERLTEDLHAGVDNWHGLDFSRFGKLRLYGKIKVGKDREAWQDLKCFLFTEMLICVKGKRAPDAAKWSDVRQTQAAGPPKYTLKGSIMITKHLNRVDSSPDDLILSLSLSVPELPYFHLHFQHMQQYRTWERALSYVDAAYRLSDSLDYDDEISIMDDETYPLQVKGKISNRNPQVGAGTSIIGHAATQVSALQSSLHIPVDIVIVLPIFSSMQGLKISLLRDTLRFLIHSLGSRDRVGLVTFGASDGAHPIVGMTTKAWSGWSKVINSIRAVTQRGTRGDLVEGANQAMDLLMQRKTPSPLSSILIISDSANTDADSIDFVVSRAEAAKVSIFCFGLGLTHKPNVMIELATRSKASYIYVKDWNMLRECVAGCLGALQSISHQNAKLRLRLPEAALARFAKISGALQVTKRASGRDAEVTLGDLHFGDRRDVLVQLVIEPESSITKTSSEDPWESIVSGLEALSGSPEANDSRRSSIEDVPMLQADLVYGDLLRDAVAQLPRPSLLVMTVLAKGVPTSPSSSSRMNKSPSSPSATAPIPPHPAIVQRRMELLVSDMLTRALTLVGRGQHQRAHHLLRETRSILQGLGKGSLPPLPVQRALAHSSQSITPTTTVSNLESVDHALSTEPGSAEISATTTPIPSRPLTPLSTLSQIQPIAAATPPNSAVIHALDECLESALEWISHPAVFARDSRKAMLQAIGVVSSQRAYTFQTPLEALWAARVSGVGRCVDAARDWRSDIGGAGSSGMAGEMFAGVGEEGEGEYGGEEYVQGGAVEGDQIG